MNLPFCNVPLPDFSGVSQERRDAIIAESNRHFASKTVGATAWRVAGIAMFVVTIPLAVMSKPLWIIFLIAISVFAAIYLPLLIFAIRSHRRALVLFAEQEIAKGA